MASSVNSAFTSRWRMSACAQTFVRTSVTVMRTSGSRSRSLATRAFTRVMSADAWSWKTGTCHASVSRRAIVLRMFESGIRSTSPAATEACNRLLLAGGGAPASARSTSSATIRPSGPVPRTARRSIPRSRARRRASGEALTRPLAAAVAAPSGDGAGSDRGSSSAFSSLLLASVGGAASATSGTSSPSAPMKATVCPTGTSPSATAILSRTPAASASTSCVTLSVSSSNSGSPFCTGSPSDLSQRTIVPDSIPWPSRGRMTSVATASALPHGPLDRVEHVVGMRDDERLHHRGERQRRELRPDSLDRRIEPVERLVLEHRSDLRAEAHPRHRLVRHHGPVRLLHRRDERLLVERLERTWVDDLDRDPVSLRLLRRLETLVHEAAGGDHGHVLALAVDAGASEWDRLDLLGDVALDWVEGPVLEEDDGVVVVDRRPEEAAHVFRSRGEHDLEPGDVDEPRLELLGVLCARRPACAALGAEDDGDGELPARHVAELRRLIHDLLGGERHEVLVHDLGDRAHALHRGADRGAGERHLRDRRVAHALLAELVEHPRRHAHRAAHLRDVLAHDEDVVVLAHRGRQCVAYGLPVGQLRHRRSSARLPGPGRCRSWRTRPRPRRSPSPRRRPRRSPRPRSRASSAAARPGLALRAAPSPPRGRGRPADRRCSGR